MKKSRTARCQRWGFTQAQNDGYILSISFLFKWFKSETKVKKEVVYLTFLSLICDFTREKSGKSQQRVFKKIDLQQYTPEHLCGQIILSWGWPSNGLDCSMSQNFPFIQILLIKMNII